jgi:outer membrane immunogenic protein
MPRPIQLKIALINKDILNVTVQAGIGGMQTWTSKIKDFSIFNGSTVEVGGLTYRLSGGYLFQVSHKLQVGPELGYMGYAQNTYKLQLVDTSYNFTTYNGHTIDLLAKAVYYFNSRFAVFGKLGFAFVNQTTKILVDPRISKTRSATLPKASIGFGYNFTPQIGISTSYDTIFGGASASQVDPFGNSDDLTKVANVSALMVGLNVSF